MYRLYHHILCPFSRKVRVHLAAKNVSFELVSEPFWERRKEFIAMNAAGNVPVLFDEANSAIICNSATIIEYIEEKYCETKNFIGETALKRAESRRIQSWFDEKFYNEVAKYILNERYFNRYLPNSKAPNSEILKIARQNLAVHLHYVEYLLESRKYLAGDNISIADFAAAAQISTLDYFGDVNWQHHQSAKEWYSLIKSHKIFGAILKDQVINIAPTSWYSQLDF